MKTRVLLRNLLNEVIADFSLPQNWGTSPDIISVGSRLFRFCGGVDGVVSYWPATSQELPADICVTDHGELVKGP